VGFFLCGHIMLDCKYPDVGLTVHPSGTLNVCCNMQNHNSEGTHISEIDDLEEYFYSTKMDKWRENFSEGWEKFVGCQNCKGPNKVYPSSLKFDRAYGLQFLEMSTSNVCNQQCVMCSSSFSSKWNKIEELFNRSPSKTYSFSDKDIEKVIKVLPRLKKLMLKGGEPFADQRNLIILEALSIVNPDCKLVIVTNGQRVSKGFINVLKKLTNVNVRVSIDGLGKRYEWIRGGDFKELEDTINLLAYTLLKPLETCPTASIYNWFYMDDLKSYIEDSICLNLDSRWPTQIVTYPKWCAPQLLLKQEDLDISSIKIKSYYSESAVEDFKKYTKVMNNVRGFDVDIRGPML